ncbi:MAG TPA: heme-binding protein [Ferruginibacter sp.]|nr:heme-binding protein [Ferruginibacter sp.]HNA02029.1 heme-binding protein [Ferruginibacter sp.]HNG64138.1 heme-binding protein [Ferruginibacter sp.]HNJ95826.1 heme-binding protein [Ferruginibacter sp.]HNN72735.1 heme-binding protein [Ferruginibacter sp.]
MKSYKNHIALLLIAAVLFSIPVKAQVLATKNISLEAARKVVAEAVIYAKANNAPGGAIAVVDAGGNLVYLERLDNTFAAASEVAIKKANTAALFKAPSSKLENSINGGRQALITVGHTFLQGGIPIIYQGLVIGAIGVSGSASAQQDEDMANAGAKAKID